MVEVLNQTGGAPSRRKPPWIRVKAPTSEGYHATRRLMREKQLHTVCEEAACPNIGECWQQGHATVMILGDTCTRAALSSSYAVFKGSARRLPAPRSRS